MMENYLTVIDMMGRHVNVPQFPKRIISLVPSQTELLYDLGLGDRVIGITKFCIHPNEWFKSKKRVGGTKQYRMEVIDALQPDLIIGNKEENERQQIEELAQKYPVWMSDILTIDDAFRMILQIGQLTQTTIQADQLVQKLKTGFASIPIPKRRKKVAYFIWKEPYMVAANKTFIDEMLKIAGFENFFSNLERYPTISISNTQQRVPDLIFLSSEPYPFKKKHADYFKKVYFGSEVKIVDGELFSWYGSRLLKSIHYFKKLQTQ